MNASLLEIINEWNPIEIYPLLQNEYQHEIKRIQKGFSESQSVQSLADLIYSIFKDSFGEQFQKSAKDCEEISKKIL